MAEQDKAAKVAAVSASAAALFGLIDLLKKQPVASGGQLQFPPELMALLAAMAQVQVEIETDIESLLAAVQELSFNAQGYPPNADYPMGGRIDLNVALTPYRLPPIIIPDGFTFLVKSWPNNPVPPALVYVSKSSGEAPNPYSTWPIVPNEVIGYNIKNAQEIWVAATVVPAAVVWTVEQRR